VAAVGAAEDFPFFFFFDFLGIGGGVSAIAGVGVETVGVSKPPGMTVGAGRGLLSAGAETDSNVSASADFFFLPFFPVEAPPPGAEALDLEPAAWDI
jgi:hypothetical protein